MAHRIRNMLYYSTSVTVIIIIFMYNNDNFVAQDNLYFWPGTVSI